MEAFSKLGIYTTILYLVSRERVMVEMKLVLVIIILGMLVIMKNQVICIMNIITIKKSIW